MIRLGRIIGAVTILMAGPGRVSAALVSCSGWDCVTGSDGGIDALLGVPVNIFNWLLGMSALVLIGVIVWAGIRMTLYQFSEMPESELGAAKLTLTRGLFGFGIVVTAYLVINTFVYIVLGLDTGSVVAGILGGFGFGRLN